jgi:hypothetical protein
LGITDASQDEKLNLLLPAADNYFKNVCGRTFEYGAFTEKVYFVNGRTFLKETPIDTITSIEDILGNSYTYEFLNETNGLIMLADNYSLIMLADNYNFQGVVEYTGGYQVIPDDIKLAVMRIVEYLLSSTEGVNSLNLEGVTANFGAASEFVNQIVNKYRGEWI